MPSVIETSKTKDAESVVTENNSLERRSSLQHQSPKLWKARELSPRQSKNMKLLEKDKALKATKFNRLNGSDLNAEKGSLISPMPLRSYQKPWPGRKSTGIEEPVKHMSNVPGYLQHMESGYDVQEKALNFGVLDWGLLEKWTYQQKHIINGRSGDSSSSSNKSSSFSTFVSSSQSGRSTASPPSQTKLSVPMDAHWNPSVISGQNNLMEEERSGHVLCLSGSETSAIKFPSAHDWQLDSDYTDCLWLENEKVGECADGKAIFHSVSLPPDVGYSCSPYKNYDTSTFTHEAAVAQDCRSSKEVRCQGYHSSLLSAENWLGKQSLDESPKKEGMWEHVQQSVRAKDKSIEFSVSNDGRSTEKTQNSPSNSSPEIVQSSFQSPLVPRSCPLPCSDLADEPYSASILLQENEVATAKSSGQIVKYNDFIGYSWDQSAFRADRLGQDEAKAPSVTGKKLPHHLSSAGSISSGLRVKQSKSITCPDKNDGDKATSNSRGRRSPLRRLLDPLLKSKHRRNMSAPIADLPIHHSDEFGDAGKTCIREELALSCVPFKSLDTGINSNCKAKGNPNFSSPASTNNSASFQGKGQAASMRHALLQLAWKNNLPLFMFSSSESDILAATMRKKCISDKDSCECIYTIFSVPEVKKKSGVWIKPGSKSTKRGLLSDVVGQIKVSCSKLTNYDSKSHSIVREFVLFSVEPLPTSHELVGSPFITELAVVIAEVLHERPESHNINVPCCSKCRYPSPMNSAENLCSCCGRKDLQIVQRNDDSNLPTLMAILPRGVHGLADTGKPSPLIQRWKSGGACDCGGWDEGCSLMILTDKFQEKRSPASAKACCNTDGTHRFDLFVQGESLEKRHAFNMISFKEGLYTVDFREPIALLQAFAICIANIHSRKPRSFSESACLAGTRLC